MLKSSKACKNSSKLSVFYCVEIYRFPLYDIPFNPLVLTHAFLSMFCNCILMYLTLCLYADKNLKKERQRDEQTNKSTCRQTLQNVDDEFNIYVQITTNCKLEPTTKNNTNRYRHRHIQRIKIHKLRCIRLCRQINKQTKQLTYGLTDRHKNMAKHIGIYPAVQIVRPSLSRPL